MESIPQASKRHLAAGSARRRGRAMAGVAATIGLLTAPAVAAASPRPVQQAPVLSVPPLCHKVSSSAVSGVVGYPVTLFFGLSKANVASPLPGISASVTVCSYVAGSSTAALQDTVLLVYIAVSKAVTIGEVRQVIKASEASEHYNVKTIKSYSGLGVPGLYASGPNGGSVFEEIAGLGGKNSNQVAGAIVAKADAKSEVAALAKLAVKAYF